MALKPSCISLEGKKSSVKTSFNNLVSHSARGLKISSVLTLRPVNALAFLFIVYYSERKYRYYFINYINYLWHRDRIFSGQCTFSEYRLKHTQIFILNVDNFLLLLAPGYTVAIQLWQMYALGLLDQLYN